MLMRKTLIEYSVSLQQFVLLAKRVSVYIQGKRRMRSCPNYITKRIGRWFK